MPIVGAFSIFICTFAKAMCVNMNMRAALVVILLLAAVRCYSTTVEETAYLYVYYPEYSRIDFVCGKAPKGTDKSVDFCCVAAYTGELLDKFSHTNIADNHISGGVLYRGYKCRANTGAFVWGKSGWRFMKKASFPQKAGGWKAGFCQLLIVLDGVEQPISASMKQKWNVYRALCEKDGRLCLVQTKKNVRFDQFIRCLKALRVKNAMYLDMGEGWNYAWYRDGKGALKELFSENKQSFYYRYRTNWITFYRK